MRALTIGFVVAFAAVLGFEADAEPGSFAGSSCKNGFGVSAASFQAEGPILRRVTGDGGSVKTISCPLSAAHTNPFGELHVHVDLVRNGTGTITCTVGSYDDDGVSTGAAVSGTMSAGTTYSLKLVTTQTGPFYTLSCTVPENSGISRYYYHACSGANNEALCEAAFLD